MNERPTFEPHEAFDRDFKGNITRKAFIEFVRNSHDHMIELERYIKRYDLTFDEYMAQWDGNLESLDEDIVSLLHEWIEDGTFADIINEDIFKTKADQVDLENVTAQLAQIDSKEESLYLNVMFPPKTLTPAKGDGITDDYPAIQGVIDYAISNGGGIIFFPAPTEHYLISDQIEVDSNIELTGVYGKSLIKLDDNVPYKCVIETKGLWTSVGHDNIIIRNLVIDGNKENQPTAPTGTGGIQHGIYIHGGKNILIENMIVYDCQGDGIFPTAFSCENVTVRNNVVKDCLRTGITVADASNVNIYDNYLLNNHLDIECEKKCMNIKVFGNYLENWRSPIQISAVNPYDLENCTVENNTIYARGDSSGDLGLAVLHFYNIKDVIFRNNHIFGRNLDDTVYSKASNVLRTQNCVNLEISGNIFKNIRGTFYFRPDGSNKIIFKDNILDSTGGVESILDVFAPFTLISGNTITGSFYDEEHKMGTIGEVGISVQGNGLIIKDNTFENIRFHIYRYSGNDHVIVGNHHNISMGGVPLQGFDLIDKQENNMAYDGTKWVDVSGTRIKSPDGSTWKVVVDNLGVITPTKLV